MSLSTLTISSVLSEKQVPTAVPKADPAYGIIGSVIKLDGRLSSDPNNNPLTYKWTFESVPIGSTVQAEGFRTIDEDGAMVSFSPDIVGEYVIGLTVSNGMFDSEMVKTVTSIRAILVPHGRGLVPDGKWIWSYIRDVWQDVENKEIFETLWSALIQIIGSELLKLYEVDFNKSIRDIQDLYQRRWLSYEPKLDIKVNGPDFYIGKHYAGNDASTINLALEGSLVMLTSKEVVLVEGTTLPNVGGESITIGHSSDPSNNTSFTISGLNSEQDGYFLTPEKPIPDPGSEYIANGVVFYFPPNGTTWTLVSANGVPYATLLSTYPSPLDQILPLFPHPAAGALDIQVGDVINYKAGPNKGFYRVVARNGFFIDVSKVPDGYSDVVTSANFQADVYRPVSFSITQPDDLLTDTIVIPFDANKDISDLAVGRLIVLNGQAYTVLRAAYSQNLRVPSVIITTDQAIIQSGLNNLTWRTPPTLVSTTQDFGDDAVSSGDLIVFDITQDGNDISHVKCQVIGVDRGRLGVVFTDEKVTPGEVPPIPNHTIESLANDFGITGIIKNDDGSLSYTGQSAQFLDTINSGIFHNTYWNTLLTPDTDISINPDYQIKPRYIHRNKRVPVDDELRSVPLLQNYITQQTVVEKDGKFYINKFGQDIEVAEPALFLKENINYTIDGEFAFDGMMVFRTGTDVVEYDDGDFVDRGILPGDQFIISDPITLSRTYYVQAVLGPTKLKLTREVPLYALGTFVKANVQIKRKSTNHCIRFVPGQFSASTPAPARLWAEVSFFDNGPNIENNFGILVGLTREDIEAVSRDLSYRQAVAGIMFAYLRGSSIDKVRLGAQILLGLPFAENRGIIRSIEGDYRKDILGNPILGRVLIEDVDNVGASLGTLRVYTYPVDPVSDLAGLETNPVTGLPLKVGDTVEKFAILSKGVEISDYLIHELDIGNTSLTQVLQQYHSVQARINDNIFTLQEIDLVSRFLRKITPSYVAFFLTTVSEFADDVHIDDPTHFKLRIGANGPLVDNASFSIPPAIMFDSKNLSGIPQFKLGDGFSSNYYWVRRSGHDLSTADGSNTVTVAGGGLLNPRSNEIFEAPLIEVTDLVRIFTGENQGSYTINSLTNTTMVLDGPTLGFEAGTGLRYAVLRPIRMDLGFADFTLSSGNPLITLASAFPLRTKGTSPGDYLLNTTNAVTSRNRFTILQVLESVPGSGVWNQLQISPTPTANGTETFAIIRSKLINSPIYGGVFQHGFVITDVGTGLGYFNYAVGEEVRGLVDAGDIFMEVGGSGREFMVLDPITRFISPPLSAAANATVMLKKKNRTASGTGWDSIKLFDPTDIATMRLIEASNRASCTNSSKIVTLQVERTTPPTSGPSALNPTTIFIKPSDFLKLEGAGNGAVDIGYGAGIYPIVQVTGTDVRLAVALTSTETVAWSIIRSR